MAYKIVARVMYGHNTVGYKAIDCIMNKTVDCSKEQAIRWAKAGQLVNATCRGAGNNLIGVGENLSKLPTFQTKSPEETRKARKNKQSLPSNIEQVEKYLLKLKAVGLPTFKYRVSDLGSIVVTEIQQTNYTGKYAIPSCVSEIASGAFAGTKFREVAIYNKPDNPMFCGGIFRSCYSDRLRVTFSNPEMIINMIKMFDGCKYLEELELSSIHTPHVMSMQGMFMGCGALKRLDLRSFDTRYIESFIEMFRGCLSLEEIIFGDWDTSRVRTMAHMFESCVSLKHIDISKFDTSSLECVNNMFRSCIHLKSIDLPKFKQDKRLKAKGMFTGCMELKIPSVHPGIDIEYKTRHE